MNWTGTTLQRIPRRNHHYPYQETPVQELIHADFLARVEFSNSVLWTDQAPVTRNGTVKFHSISKWTSPYAKVTQLPTSSFNKYEVWTSWQQSCWALLFSTSPGRCRGLEYLDYKVSILIHLYFLMMKEYVDIRNWTTRGGE